MRNARLHQLKLAAVLLCAAATASAQSTVPGAAAPAAAPAPAAGTAPVASPPASTATAPAAAPVAAAKPAGLVPPPADSAQPVDSIAVVVNDEVITRNELAARVKSVVRRMEAQKVQLPEQADLNRQILERMIVERAQLQLAKEMGVRVDDSTLDRAIGRIAESQKMNLQQMRDQLEKEGTPYAAFREEIRQEIIMQRLREHEVDAKIQISDAEVDEYLAQQKAFAAEQVEWNLSQILVRIPENSNSEQIAGRRARAEEVMRNLRTGADFSKMAATYSDAGDALKGGEIGWRNPDRLPPLFVEQLSKLKPGQVTPIIQSSVGFHILKLVDKRTAAEAQAVASVQQTHARHILIKVTPTMTVAEATHRLVDLRERLENHAAKFEDLARQYSNDGSASKGGDLGWLEPGDTVPEFENAMNALKPGDISQPIVTTYGVHLIEVLERKTDDASKLKERDAARNAIRERKLQEATEDWQREIRDRAYVEFRSNDDK